MPSTSPVPQQSHGRSLTRHRLTQHGRLSIGVGGIGGGLVLLTSNTLTLLAVGATTLPWVPLVANCALIFGGVMFLREYRRAKSPPSE